jgi:hypothetical protein
MTELQQLRAMLERAGTGHGLRYNYNPSGTSVLVETDEDENGFQLTEFCFGADGVLQSVTSYPGEVG